MPTEAVGIEGKESTVVKTFQVGTKQARIEAPGLGYEVALAWPLEEGLEMLWREVFDGEMPQRKPTVQALDDAARAGPAERAQDASGHLGNRPCRPHSGSYGRTR